MNRILTAVVAVSLLLAGAACSDPAPPFEHGRVIEKDYDEAKTGKKTCKKVNGKKKCTTKGAKGADWDVTLRGRLAARRHAV